MRLPLITSIGDDHVNGPKVLLRALHEVFDILLLRHIRDEACHLSVRRFQLGKKSIDLGLAGGRKGHLRPFREKCLDDRCADTACTTCDEHYLVLEFQIHCGLLS